MSEYLKAEWEANIRRRYAEARAKPNRRCPGCGAAERVDELGYSNIAGFLGYCCDCITRSMEDIRREEADDGLGR